MRCLHGTRTRRGEPGRARENSSAPAGRAVCLQAGQGRRVRVRAGGTVAEVGVGGPPWPGGVVPRGPGRAAPLGVGRAARVESSFVASLSAAGSELGCPLDDQFVAGLARILFGLSMCPYSDTNLMITNSGVNPA